MSGAHDEHHGHGAADEEGHSLARDPHGPARDPHGPARDPHGPARDPHGPAPLSESERYELADLFPEEAPENQHFVMVAGTVLLVVLLALALAYPFLHT